MNISSLYQIFLSSTGIFTDSRKVKKGAMFFALRGERFDGNNYVSKVLEGGASYAVIDKKDKCIDDRCIIVEHTLLVLQELAQYHRRAVGVKMIAITGSNGKTTTKELLNNVLSTTYQVHCTKGNFNNHIGVPLTILEMPLSTELAIIEMGANHPREIEFLCRIAEPNYGLVTNVGKAHLEGFGGFEGVIKTKRELYDYLAKNNGKAFVNIDEAHLADMAAFCKNKLQYAKEGVNDNGNISYPKMMLKKVTPFVEVAFGENGTYQEVKTNLIGTYNLPNILTAITVGNYFKVTQHNIKVALENYIPTNNRSEFQKIGSNKIILDAYNANPTSMKAAIENFRQLEAVHKIIVIGDMLELGKDSEKEHLDIIKLVLGNDFEQIITVGEKFKKVNTNTEMAFLTLEELKNIWEWKKFQNTFFLIKGSRGIGLEKLLPS